MARQKTMNRRQQREWQRRQERLAHEYRKLPGGLTAQELADELRRRLASGDRGTVHEVKELAVESLLMLTPADAGDALETVLASRRHRLHWQDRFGISSKSVHDRQSNGGQEIDENVN